MRVAILDSREQGALDDFSVGRSTIQVGAHRKNDATIIDFNGNIFGPAIDK